MKKIHLYEVLIRFDPETGAPRGAHKICCKTVTDEDGDVHVKPQAAETVALDDLADLIGAEAGNMVAEISRLKEDNTRLSRMEEAASQVLKNADDVDEKIESLVREKEAAEKGRAQAIDLADDADRRLGQERERADKAEDKIERLEKSHEKELESLKKELAKVKGDLARLAA